MSDYCKQCGQFKLSDRHTCTRYECAVPWKNAVDEGNWSEVWAYDAEAAAEKYAEECDSDGDYSILKHGSGEIWVREGAERTITKWFIEAESEPTYRASKLDDSTSIKSDDAR